MTDQRAGDAEYEGLFCTICGAESGSTDLCVPCADKAFHAEQKRAYEDDLMEGMRMPWDDPR